MNVINQIYHRNTKINQKDKKEVAVYKDDNKNIVCSAQFYFKIKLLNLLYINLFITFLI